MQAINICARSRSRSWVSRCFDVISIVWLSYYKFDCLHRHDEINCLFDLLVTLTRYSSTFKFDSESNLNLCTYFIGAWHRSCQWNCFESSEHNYHTSVVRSVSSFHLSTTKYLFNTVNIIHHLFNTVNIIHYLFNTVNIIQYLFLLILILILVPA